MGKKNSLVLALRAFLRYRTMVGLTTLTESRLKRLKKYINDYQKASLVCSTFSNDPHLIYCVRLFRVIMEKALTSQSIISKAM
jgi:hypothetical protein